MRYQKSGWIVWVFMLASVLACNLARIKTIDTIPRSEVTPVDMNGWVAYNGRGVRMGAPAGQWSQVPFDQNEANTLLSAWQLRDPSVANIFFNLMGRSANEFYKLVLLKDDGTASLEVTGSSLADGSSFESVVQQARQSLIDQNNYPRQQRLVSLSVGDAVRWETSISPIGSQIINRQLQYIVMVNTQVYYLTFTAQAVDFEGYIPVFEAMALTFLVS